LKKLWLLSPIFLFATEDFITDLEYGQMLYKNPRGISCAACHGIKGEKKEIVSYMDKDKKRVTIYASDIRKVSLAKLKSTLARNHPIMPKYYLTTEEITAIYYYIQMINQDDESDI